MLTVEFHCHTRFSADSLTKPADLLARCRARGIDRVIITDHDTIAGALVAKKLDPERVIVGEEIMTTGGELLAAFVLEEVPAYLPPLEAVRRLREQGAFISVSHPFDRFRGGAWRRDDLLQIAQNVDAIEVYNSRCTLPGFNQQAREFARTHRIAGTVGSDAHAAFEVGRAVLVVEDFSDADSLRRVLAGGQATVRWSPPWFHFASRYAVLFKRVARNLDTQKQK
jgi:hypothetical protein